MTEKKKAGAKTQKKAAPKIQKAMQAQKKEGLAQKKGKEIQKEVLPTAERTAQEKTAPARTSGVNLGRATAQDFEWVKFPLISEKAVNMIEGQNKLTFITDKRATKPSIKEVIERVYGVKVDSVNIVNDMKGRKKAIVKINKAFKAEEVATRLGVI